ncbi:MAG: O-antigen ligase family protein [Tannerellaceae bacterium]|jgi:hypothetical protein|nr:O-antigen ligase family protein [Tannerellaceae bacterium]
MEITFSGYFFLIVYFIAIFFPVKYLFAITLYSSIFGAMAVFNLNYKGITPFIVGLIFFNLKSIFLPTKLRHNNFPNSYLVCLFLLYSILYSIVIPIIGSENRQLSLKNYTQLVYIIIYTITLYSAYKIQNKVDASFLIKLFKFMIISVVAIGLWEFFAKSTNMISFPNSFFFNNKGYSLLYDQELAIGGQKRLNSTFIEPSYAGSFLAASFCMVVILGIKKNILFLLLILTALVFNLSATGMLSTIFGVLFCMFINIKNWKQILALNILLLLTLYIVYKTDYFTFFIEILLRKKDSLSGESRLESTVRAINLFKESGGIGLGLGVYRSASFISDIIVSYGIIGTFLFCKLYYTFIRTIVSRNTWLFVFAIVLLCAQCIAIPDISNQIMWMWIFMSVSLNHYNK